MKAYKITDESYRTDEPIAYLFHYEKTDSFFIELSDRIDEIKLPILLDSFARKGIYSIGAEWSRRWVQQRVIPPDRQNLGMVLRENGLKEYDIIRLLMKGQGRCAQDDCSICPVREADLPDWVKERLSRKLVDVMLIGGSTILAAFTDGTMRRIDLSGMIEASPELEVIAKEKVRFMQIRLQHGGNGICWQDWQVIPAEELYQAGELMPVTFREYLASIKSSIMDTTEVCEYLHCSRQYVDSLVKNGRLTAAKESGRTRLYYRKDVLPLKW